MKIFFKIFLFFLVIAIACGLWLWREATNFLDTPPTSEGKEIYFDVPPGAHLARIANNLAERGLITDSRKFIWLAKFEKAENRLQAGRFLLNTGWTPRHVLDTLINGHPALYRVTVPEGLTWWQTAKVLEDAGLARFDDFREIIHNPEFLRKHGIPFASAEGFLMPDTYLLKKPDSPMPAPGSQDGQSPEDAALQAEWRAQAETVAARMIDNFWRKSARLWPRPPSTLNDEAGKEAAAQMPVAARPATGNLRKWVTLASIVEKETAINSERPTVAGVYTNRLAKNMPLQADPTIIYGLGPEFSGSLRRSQLDDASNAYNTYQHPGLPPGPICSFGAAALEAAINPEKHDFLYFVATTDGGSHTFSRTLNEHDRAVRDYRRQKQNR